MDLTTLFSETSPSVLGFISKLSVGPRRPHFPTILGTGFFVDSSGLAVTNRHVIDFFSQIPPHPQTKESSLAAVFFLPSDDGVGWQMLRVDVVSFAALAHFTSSENWYGETVPDIGYVQLAVREVKPLKLANEKGYLNIGMDVATIGYPMGDLPLTALGKLNQASPFLRCGIVSSVFPCPCPLPHGFTMDIMQQGGSSGSPILRADDGVVVGMMAKSILDWNVAQSREASLAYSMNTNISICEPGHIIRMAVDEFLRTTQREIDHLPTLSELRKKYPRPDKDAGLEWETWTSR